VLALGVAACGDSSDSSGSDEPEGHVSAADFGKRWPLTVDEGVLACDGSNGTGAVTFETDGKTYGLNGLAPQNLPDIDPIWKMDNTTGLRVDISPLINAGLKLC
jgi:hypothetical protein